jgi:septal ring factor EnvC (AmiA/AmiB activator)
MPARKIARRRKVLPGVAAVVQPVTKRLSRIEDLLTEIRHEQDVKHKKIAALQAQLEELTASVKRRFQLV